MTSQEKLTSTLAKRIGKGLKADLAAESIRQNYKGTGSKVADRQLYCRFKNGAVIDLWVYGSGVVQLGGCCERHQNGAHVRPATRAVPAGETIDDTYEAVRAALAAWLNPPSPRIEGKV